MNRLNFVVGISFDPSFKNKQTTYKIPTFRHYDTAAEQYGVAKFTSDAMDVINDPDVDAVWICSPSQYHAEQIKAAAANGKHVFCEKPIATDLSETVEAINACNEAGVKLMIGLQRRFDENFKRVRTAVEKKEVGDTIMVSEYILFRKKKIGCCGKAVLLKSLTFYVYLKY